MKHWYRLALAGTALALALSGCGGTAASGGAEAVSEEPAVVSEEPVIVSEEPVVVSEEPGIVSEEPAASEEPAEEPAVEAPEEIAEEAEEFDVETLFQDYLTEPPVAEMYAAVADKFQAMEYVDEETGLTIPYNLFVPEAAEACPMVLFIADSSVVGRDLSAPLSQGYGGIIWATDEEQAKRPCYVLVPEYPEIIIEDNTNPPYILDYVEATARMVEQVARENNVDGNRIYATGQSMGCMTSLYLAANHPDLFAAELFVSGQWQMDELPELDTQTFFYIACSGDSKSSQGQADVMAMLDEKGIPYTWSDGWDPALDDAGMEDVLREAIEADCSIHVGRFEGLNHMSSFDYAYQLDAVRGWLFAQSR